MSSRALRKAYGSAEDELKKINPNSEDEDPVHFISSKKKNVKNPYELLELSESDAKEDDDIEGEEKLNDSDGAKVEEEPSQSTSSKKKKKKKPGKKKKNKIIDSGITTQEDDDGTRLGEKTKIKKGVPHSRSIVVKEAEATSQTSKFDEVFKINNSHLNPEVELKKIFGAKVVNYERGKQGQRRVYRMSKLIAPKAQWPTMSGSGISMDFIGQMDGKNHYKFEHNSHYQNIQKKFIEAVESLNPDNIVNILKVHPYHIDSHIQLSDMAKAAEDMQVAAELIEGALYCLESAFHAGFILSQPNLRLDYKYQENRAFFILLFKHLQFVGQRACQRTALELSKRLLSFDPENDPLAVSLLIDFYAVKSGENEWLLKLYDLWEKKKNLNQLPNFAFSTALAAHFISLEKEEMKERADNLIQYALLMFPSILLPLLNKMGVQADSRSVGHSYFNSYAAKNESKSLKLLCDMYVWRSHHVWKQASIPAWLEKNVRVVLDLVDSNSPLVKEYEEKRKRRYGVLPRNILRHVLLVDSKELTFELPVDLRKEAILNYDPLPPSDSIDIYKRDKQRSNSSGDATGQRGGLFSMLFRSLLYDLNGENRQEQLDQFDARRHQIAEAAAAELPPPLAVGAGLQESVTALLDAMRELLANVNGPRENEDPDAADGEETDELEDLD